jgi:signal transduction histidine kinase
MDPMSARTSHLLVGAVGVLTLAALGSAWWLNQDDGQNLTPATVNDVAIALVLVVALTVNLVVGAVVALARRDNPVGWLFLLLGLVLVLEAPAAEYVQHGTGLTGDLPGARVAVVLAGSSWILWFTIVALILLLTPTGQPLSPRWRHVAVGQVTAGTVAYLLAIPSAKAPDPPYDHVQNPMHIDAIQPWADRIGTVCVYAIGLGLIASGFSLLLRFRRARDDERRQLLWLVFAAAPIPLYVVVAFVSSRNGADVVTAAATGGFITVIPIAAGLSVLRYRLYDVERIVSTTLTWSAWTAILVATYALVVWLGAQAVPSGSVPPEVAATIGAVLAAGLALPLRRWLQDQADRRFNRRAYDARRVIGAALAAEDAGMDVEAVLRDALTDPTLTVAYPGPDGEWVRSNGQPAQHTGSHTHVDRHGRVIARIDFDPDVNDVGTLRRATALAAADLDNARLRAELAGRLEEIDASRRRLAVAQRAERRRIERDLHDGAQQSLLALAFELQSAQVNGDPDRMRAALAAGSTAAREAVRELRELANGLHPAALVDGGLTAALDDLARHSPVPLRLDVASDRLDPALEFTAWLVLGEAITNAQKHAGADSIEVGVARENGHLRLRVCDDGRGGARPDGPGLRGLRDRVETAQGELEVTSGPAGTTVEAVLPCGS